LGRIGPPDQKIQQFLQIFVGWQPLKITPLQTHRVVWKMLSKKPLKTKFGSNRSTRSEDTAIFTNFCRVATLKNNPILNIQSSLKDAAKKPLKTKFGSNRSTRSEDTAVFLQNLWTLGQKRLLIYRKYVSGIHMPDGFRN